jgi:hypothetical protein
MKRYTIDRFEGDLAVCESEDLGSIDIKRADLPAAAKEGDSLIYDGVRYFLDAASTDECRERIQKKVDDLFVD